MKEPTLLVSCPTCGSPPGEWCVLTTGQPRIDPHLERVMSAQQQNRFEAEVRPQAGNWKDIAELASKEKEPAKLRALVQELLYSLAQEQRHYKDDIESRLDQHFRATQSAADPSGS